MGNDTSSQYRVSSERMEYAGRDFSSSIITLLPGIFRNFMIKNDRNNPESDRFALALFWIYHPHTWYLRLYFRELVVINRDCQLTFGQMILGLISGSKGIQSGLKNISSPFIHHGRIMIFPHERYGARINSYWVLPSWSFLSLISVIVSWNLFTMTGDVFLLKAKYASCDLRV